LGKVVVAVDKHALKKPLHRIVVLGLEAEIGK
jgi:hypothetical protein